MALNPIVYTDKIVRSFLKYELTTYPLSLQGHRMSPLMSLLRRPH